MIFVGSPQFGAALDTVSGGRLVNSWLGKFELVEDPPLTVEERARVLLTASRFGARMDDGRPVAAARLQQLLSPTQLLVPLDEIVWATLRGVDEVAVIRQGLWRQRIIAAAADVEAGPLGESQLRPGAVAAVVVEYRYLLTGLGIAREEARIRYPLADGSGDALVTDPQVTSVRGPDTIRLGREARARATTQAGFLLGVGVALGLGETDPGPTVSALLARLSTAAQRDLVAAYERSRDEALLVALAAAPEPWLDTPLPSGSVRELALAELRETVTGPDGWTPWPSSG